MKTRRPQEPRNARVAGAAPEPDAGSAPVADEPHVDAASDAISGGDWNLASHARTLRFDAGLYALSVGGVAVRVGAADIPLPATFVSTSPANERGSIAIISISGAVPGWLNAGGGSAVINVGPAGGVVVVTTYGAADEAALPTLKVIDLNRVVDARPEAVVPDTVAEQGREIPVEITLHIERQGDRHSLARGWQGNLGQRLRIEGFGIRPLEAIAPGDVEYMGFGPKGRRTPWVNDAKLCGTRGRGIPLTGFAIRLALALRERFDVVYEGAFFNSGTQGPHRNGEPCLPSIADDPLEAIRMRVIERAGA